MKIKQRLWRAADDDIIVGSASFSPDRSCAEAYLNNPPFGGSRLWVTDVEVDDKQVLDLRDGARRKLRKLGITGFEGTTIDQIVPYIVGELQEHGYIWVRHEETFPQHCEDTWTFVGSGDSDPELRRVKLNSYKRLMR